MTTLVWFRQDLRLGDNPALAAALDDRDGIVPVYIHDPDPAQPWTPGAASRWWLHHSLAALEEELQPVGSRLILRVATELFEELRQLAATSGATRIVWNRCYEPGSIARDQALKAKLRAAGFEVASYNAALLREPWEVRTRTGGPFQVFTPFWKSCLASPDPAPPLATPTRLPPPSTWPTSEPLAALQLLPRLDWARGFPALWQPGRQGALRRLAEFLERAFAGYGDARNRPDLAGTSRLSPHLHFGEISPREIWHELRAHATARPALAAEPAAAGTWRQSQFVAELGWREFAHHLLYHFPQTPEEPLRASYARFPWRQDPDGLKAWQQGRTGFPIVDAGMRELWTTGWMHNRVRMIVGSFLVKDLLLPWQDGARWFWDTLVDADLAANTLGWQWAAGCGADAAPFFRVFNPTLQGGKFDPEGAYVRRWVPELAGLPDQWIHEPAAAPPGVLTAAGVTLGKTYPRPIVDHGAARRRALEALKTLR